MPNRGTWTHMSFCWERIVLCVCALSEALTLTYRQFIICICLICQTFIPSEILSSNITSCNFINTTNGNFKFLVFDCSRPSARSKWSVSHCQFSAGRMHSSPSAGHTMMSNCWLCHLFLLGVLSLTPFCREQVKCSHCQFFCWAHAFTSFCRAHNDI